MNASKLHERIASVAPVVSVRIISFSPRAVQIEFQPAATPEQRAAAQAIVDGWTEADWEGTPAERRLARRERIIAIHSIRYGLTIERDYWQAQGSAARVTAINAKLAELQTEIDTLRPQS